MIRINLIPSDDRKKRRKIALPSISGGVVLWTGVVLGIYGAGVFAVSALQVRTLKEYERKIEAAKEESARLAPQLAKIRKLTKEREEVNKRLSIIAQLDRDRYLRVQALDEIAVQVPRNCWLTKVIEQGGSRVQVEGITFSNLTIADLMANMESSERYTDVSLKVAEEGLIEGHKVVKFALNSKIVN